MFFKTKSNINIKNTNKLKGKIIIGYCRSDKTFIVFINLKGYKEQYKRLVPSENVLFSR